MDDSIKGIAALSLSLYVNIREDNNTYFYSGGVFFISLQNEGGDKMHVNKCIHECNGRWHVRPAPAGEWGKQSGLNTIV